MTPPADLPPVTPDPEPIRPKGSAFSSADFDDSKRSSWSSSSFSSSDTPKGAQSPEEQRRAKIRTAIIIVAVIAAVAFGAGWNPPTRTVHKFTSASDYNVTNDSGCTNSGAGCHGSEKSYKDFNAYHPKAVCLDCHDYQGVACIPCHMPREHECALCHDGSMKNAPDVVRISDPFPKGHYRETSHTAVGTIMGTPVIADAEVAITAPGATGASAATFTVTSSMARATCRDCHSRDLRAAHTKVPVVAGSTYGDTLGCGECHNDVRAFGQAEVVSKWKSGRRCESCHKIGSSVPMHATNVATSTPAESPLSCGESGPGCHEGNQLHALHASAPKDCSGSAKKGEPACHQLGTESLKPTVKSCGGDTETSCHPATASGTYPHKRVDSTHSPTTRKVADDTSYYETPCGSCHFIAPDGKSLLAEHARPTSARSASPDSCRNCHGSKASAQAISDSWPEKSTAQACSACHGKTGLAPVHSGEISTVHTVKSGSAGCANSGPGCHPTDDISEVGQPTTSSNIHTNCVRCHDTSTADGNMVYDPAKKTCGSGRACHNTPGAYDPTSAVHDGAAGRVDGADDQHMAGAAQLSAVLRDADSGVSTKCGACHQASLGKEHARPTSSLAQGNTCRGCHNESVSAGVVKDDWTQRETSAACGVCHPTVSPLGLHGDLQPAHVGVELGPDGVAAPGTCVRSGCHGTRDLRKLHRTSGCTATGCHTDSGGAFGRDVKSCGGGNGLTSCHVGYSAQNHFVSHRADLAGTHAGITYVQGANVGCFGCHNPDLDAEHSRELAAGSLDGTADSSCHICHADADDPGSGTYAASTSVARAVAKHDMRCASCHASGTAYDTSAAVASPHKNLSATTPLPAGRVWADPMGEWKAAFDGPSGGGHNSLSATLVDGATQKQFPVTGFVIGGVNYTWALPPNTGATTWLKASALTSAAVETTESIQHITVGCSDCHAMPADMTGPHGASVHVGIDPGYSQTEYADPTPTAYQFRATGTNRVICMKCHNMESDPATGLVPGGNRVHARHVTHDTLPATDPQHYGSKCIDCHVRIPHAWKRPRLLIRTAVTTDGASPDTFPYVAQGHNGLAGIVLRSYETSSALRSRYCATSGCHPGHTATRHPLPSEIPTAPLWP